MKKIISTFALTTTFLTANAQTSNIPIVSDLTDLLADLGIALGSLAVAIGLIGIGIELIKDESQQQEKAQKIKSKMISIVSGGAIFASIGAIAKYWESVSKLFS